MVSLAEDLYRVDYVRSRDWVQLLFLDVEIYDLISWHKLRSPDLLTACHKELGSFTGISNFFVQLKHSESIYSTYHLP